MKDAAKQIAICIICFCVGIASCWLVFPRRGYSDDQFVAEIDAARQATSNLARAYKDIADRYSNAIRTVGSLTNELGEAEALTNAISRDNIGLAARNRELAEQNRLLAESIGYSEQLLTDAGVGNQDAAQRVVDIFRLVDEARRIIADCVQDIQDAED